MPTMLPLRKPTEPCLKSMMPKRYFLVDIKVPIYGNVIFFKTNLKESYNYNAIKIQIGAPGGDGEYVVQEGFGWTNGVVLDFLSKYGDLINSHEDLATLESDSNGISILIWIFILSSFILICFQFLKRRRVYFLLITIIMNLINAVRYIFRKRN